MKLSPKDHAPSICGFHRNGRENEDGVWVIECRSIPGCVSQGKTKEEALENIKDAIELCLEVRGERDASSDRKT